VAQPSPPASAEAFPASPTASRLAVPGWLNARSAVGLLLVLATTLGGARLLGAADDTQSVWVATRDLAVGSTLAAGDLEPAQVRLLEQGERYLLAGGPGPLGYVLQAPLAAGELVPRSGLVRPDDPGRPLRDVSVPVEAGHLPGDLRAGQQVDVYVTAGAGPAGAPPASLARAAAPTGTRLVLQGVAVTARPAEGGVGARASGVVLSVPADEVTALVAAVQGGAIDLVRVPRPVG